MNDRVASLAGVQCKHGVSMDEHCAECSKPGRRLTTRQRAQAGRIAARLLDTLDTLSTGRTSASDMATMHNLAAVVRDLDAVSRGEP